MDTSYQASRAVIIFPDTGVRSVMTKLESCLTQRGYVVWPNPLPANYRPYTNEWLGFVMTRSDDTRHTVVVPEDISEVFRIAHWLAESLPSSHFLAWRRFQGDAAVIKYYSQGKPQLKVGRDDDVELHWSIPTELPVNIASPEELGLPTTGAQVEDRIGTATRPYRQQMLTLGPLDQALAFLSKDSMLAG